MHTLHKGGVADDSAAELVAAAKKIDAGAAVTAIVTGSRRRPGRRCQEVAAIYARRAQIQSTPWPIPMPKSSANCWSMCCPADAIVWFPMTPSAWTWPGPVHQAGFGLRRRRRRHRRRGRRHLESNPPGIRGMVSTHVSCDISNGAVINLRPGSFQAPTRANAAGGSVEDRSGDVGDLTSKRTFLEVVEAEVGDVDITKSDVLVSVGRGIEDEENIEIAQELADAMGAVVSCSRPIVDAKWLEKSRQVGTSGQTVKPKVYMACGISGSSSIMGGIKGFRRLSWPSKKQKCQGAHLPGGRRGHRSRHP
jgi:electron transfer flavoprotein alpha subunit